MAEAELRSYTPSWRERLAEGFSKLMPGDEDPWSVDMGHKLTGLAEMIPGVGAFTYGNDAYRSAQAGNVAGAFGNAAMAGLSAIPMAGLDKTKALVGRSPYAPIPGTPPTFKLPGGETLDAKPIPAIVDAAADYAKSRGMPHQVPASFPKQDPENARSIAQWYGSAPDESLNPETIAAYKQLADETLGQYDALTNRGIGFEFMKRGDDGNVIDPYAASPALGYKDLSERGKLEIFPTDAGFGTINDAAASNPLLQYSGRDFGDQPATYNDLFRAVHDGFGHFGYGNQFFRAPGEERAWGLHSMMFSPESRKAMTAETRGQNSWLNFGPHADHNKGALGADTIFADQKALSAPDWVVNDPNLKAQELGAFVPGIRTMGPAPAPLLDSEERR
jgi:hypothetical protein